MQLSPGDGGDGGDGGEGGDGGDGGGEGGDGGDGDGVPLQKQRATLPTGVCGHPAAAVFFTTAGFAKHNRQLSPPDSVQLSPMDFQHSSLTSGVRHGGSAAANEPRTTSTRAVARG